MIYLKGSCSYSTGLHIHMISYIINPTRLVTYHALGMRQILPSSLAVTAFKA